jgi:hypothetical protein
LTYLNAEQLGLGENARLLPLVSQAHRHMQHWFVKEDAPYVRPLMVALTCHALTAYYDRKKADPEILDIVKKGMDRLWQETWLPAEQAFKYTDRQHESGGTEPAPDLNLLIAPVFAWLYQQTGEAAYRDRGDMIFAGGVRRAYLEQGKQFNQNYLTSFDYVRLRRLYD